MYVIGTAGHVDHGKSTLVKALTGIDPDRLREEKERGMTIDLGFAWLRLPDGREVSLVDVPGHERFIKNMLAGVGGIDLALLVVAADEGVMPQTREHVAILELLGIHRAVVALSKIDLVEPDWLDLVRSDVQEYLARTPLAGAPIVPVSALTGAGLDQLIQTLVATLAETPPRPDLGRPRLPIDRVFTVAGFGTVVTGTLTGGRLHVGQELEVQPGGLRTRSRGIQTHRQKVEVALPGTRVAVNLAGLATEHLWRGQVVTVPGWLQPTTVVDAHVRVLAEAGPLVHNSVLSFHSGTAETMARVIVLEGERIEPGASGWIQLRLAAPLALARGDLFVLRTPNATVGGGEVVDAHARRHRRSEPGLLARLEILRRGAPTDRLRHLLEQGPQEPGLLGLQTGLEAETVQRALASLQAQGEIVTLGDLLTARRWWEQCRERVLGTLRAYHQRHPLRAGMPREELKSRLGFPPRLFGAVVQRLVAEGTLAETGPHLRLAEHTVRFGPDLAERVERLLGELGREPYAPPSLPDLMATLGLDEEVIAALVEQGRLVRLNESVALRSEVYREMVERVVALLREKGQVTVAEVRDLFGTSRKYVLALLEYMDQQHLTRRVGDVRVLRERVGV